MLRPRPDGADWADRQLTHTRDNLGLYGGEMDAYNAAIYGDDPEGGHPNILAGLGRKCHAGGIVPVFRMYGFYSRSHGFAFHPINFPDNPASCGTCEGWGWFRFGVQTKPISSYLNGRYHDPIFFAPKDRAILDRIDGCFDWPDAYVVCPRCNPAYSSYCLSPAGLYAPEVFDPGQKVAPWDMPTGYRVPSFGQVRFPALKTHMLEHNWLQNTKDWCNDAFEGCEPYAFNHSFQSAPVTMFYDGSLRLMTVLEAMSADRRQERQAGAGLWSRQPHLQVGGHGYFNNFGYDFADTAFHILTAHGVRGRDTISGQ